MTHDEKAEIHRALARIADLEGDIVLKQTIIGNLRAKANRLDNELRRVNAALVKLSKIKSEGASQ